MKPIKRSTRLLRGHGRPPGLGQVRGRGRVDPEVRLAAAEDDGRGGAVPPDLADPLVLHVVERDGVGDVEAEQEDVGVVVGEGAHRVVGGRAWKKEVSPGIQSQLRGILHQNHHMGVQ